MNQIYHLAPAARWREWPSGEPYLPAEYADDGFVHCTAGGELMVQAAVHDEEGSAARDLPVDHPRDVHAALADDVAPELDGDPCVREVGTHSVGK